MLKWIWAAVLLGVLLSGQNTEPPQSKPEPPARGQSPKPQPVPFSHKSHARLGLECLSCHEMPEPGWEMTYPSEEKCMQCHGTIKTESAAIIKLAQYYRDRRPVPWVPVYRVPDYVAFSHQRHVKKAGTGCDVCHGPVAQRDVIVREKSIAMTACMDCHKEKGAPNTCRTCHNR